MIVSSFLRRKPTLYLHSRDVPETKRCLELLQRQIDLRGIVTLTAQLLADDKITVSSSLAKA
jgi:hypothetical protein